MKQQQELSSIVFMILLKLLESDKGLLDIFSTFAIQ